VTQATPFQENRPPPAHAVLAALERIERRLEHLEERLDRLDALASQAPGALAAFTDTFDTTVAYLQARGVDVDGRLRALLALTERLTHPATLRALEKAAELATEAPNLVAAAVDNVDGLIERLHERGVDVDDRAKTTLAIAERLTSPPALAAVREVLDHIDDLQHLLHSGVLDKSAVRLVGELGKALAATSAEASPRVGAFGALRALGDPDIQRALGFTLQLASRFGAALKEVPPALPRGGS
jgi:uncharacterized protein YjgD (DUF1641 family)